MTTNILNCGFDKIYCITLLNQCERHEHVLSEFNRYNVEFEFITSVSPTRLFSTPECTTQERSLLLSHLACIKNAKVNGWNNVLIFEDDFKFYDDWEENVGSFMCKIPHDWRIIYFGESDWVKYVWPTRQEKLMDEVYRCKYGCGSHCMAINSLYYDDIIKEMESFNKAVDFYYQWCMERYDDCYTPEIKLCDSISAPHDKYIGQIPGYDKNKYIKSLIREFSTFA